MKFQRSHNSQLPNIADVAKFSINGEATRISLLVYDK